MSRMTEEWESVENRMAVSMINCPPFGRQFLE
jgi:hypothetical protein